MIDKDIKDKIANAKNPYCPLVRLNELATDESFEVRRAVVNNPNCPSSILKKTYEFEDQRCIDSAVLREIILHPNLSIKDTINLFRRYKDKTSFNYGETFFVSDLINKLNNALYDKTITNETLEAIASLRGMKFFFIGSNGKYDYLSSNLSNVAKIAKRELFRRRIKGIYIPEEEPTLDEKNAELEHQRLLEKQKEKDIESAKESIGENLKRIKELISFLIVNDIPNNLKISIPEDELIIKVDDHLEINPFYLGYIDFIDFKYIKTSNLKVSNINWSRTNISIDPQTVYKKDLSNAKFSDYNITFKSFAGCDLRGTDISEELDSIDIQDAITDESTNIHPNLVEDKKRLG